MYACFNCPLDENDVTEQIKLNHLSDEAQRNVVDPLFSYDFTFEALIISPAKVLCATRSNFLTKGMPMLEVESIIG